MKETKVHAQHSLLIEWSVPGEGLCQKRVVDTKFDIYVFITITGSNHHFSIR
jgi:hypothetical protein